MFDSDRNLTYTVTHELGIQIVRGDYGAENIFPIEANLAEKFNVSRSIIREAIKMLSAKGLIVSRPKRGIAVMPSEFWNMFDSDVILWRLNSASDHKVLKELLEIRIAFEPEAVRLAAINADPEDVNNFKIAINKIISHDDFNSFLSATTEFHTAVLSASKNLYFMQLGSIIRSSEHLVRNLRSNVGLNVESIVKDYTLIYGSLCFGEPEKASNQIKVLISKMARQYDLE